VQRLLVATAALLTAGSLALTAPTAASPSLTQQATREVANGTVYRPLGDVRVPPTLHAKAWVVVDMASGNLLGKHGARARLPQASTIKLLTALTATHRIPADEPLRATRLAASTICSCAGVRAGLHYTRAKLFGGMLVKSGNDAAEAIAGADPRGRARFIAGMNNTAERLGAVDTVAKNPSGLDQAGAHSSARDLLVLLREAARRPDIIRWLDKPSMRFGAIGGPRHRLDSTTDYLLMYEDSYAAKNGFTTNAGNTLVAASHYVDRDGVEHDIGVAVLGSQAGFTTTGARALTRWAANNAALLAPVGRLPGS
jgi:serine-type D-Ala-D-Ala carboxypeptidase (penicillin-binding protein 5/6)